MHQHDRLAISHHLVPAHLTFRVRLERGSPPVQSGLAHALLTDDTCLLVTDRPSPIRRVGPGSVAEKRSVEILMGF